MPRLPRYSDYSPNGESSSHQPHRRSRSQRDHRVGQVHRRDNDLRTTRRSADYAEPNRCRWRHAVNGTRDCRPFRFAINSL